MLEILVYGSIVLITNGFGFGFVKLVLDLFALRGACAAKAGIGFSAPIHRRSCDILKQSPSSLLVKQGSGENKCLVHHTLVEFLSDFLFEFGEFLLDVFVYISRFL